MLVAASLPVAVIHQIYFMQAGPFFENQLGMLVTYIAPAMTVGQFAEIGFLALLGTLLMRLGFKWTITLGALAYFARYTMLISHRILPDRLWMQRVNSSGRRH